MKLWLSQKTILEQDPNADDYDKYSLPLGREDTNEEIIEEGTENTEGIESTRLRYLKVLKVPDWMTLDMQAVSKNCPILIRLVREMKVSELIPKHRILDKRLDSYEPFDEAKSAEQPPYHLIGPYNYHVPWFAFWAFAYIKLIPD